jgi:hypothetical protein
MGGFQGFTRYSESSPTLAENLRSCFGASQPAPAGTELEACHFKLSGAGGKLWLRLAAEIMELQPIVDLCHGHLDEFTKKERHGVRPNHLTHCQ